MALAHIEVVHHKLEPVRSHAWYTQGMGRGLGFIMLIVLGLCCYLLARKGADWQLAAQQAKQESAKTS